MNIAEYYKQAIDALSNLNQSSLQMMVLRTIAKENPKVLVKAYQRALNPEAYDVVKDALAHGCGKVQAVKRYKDLTGKSLQESHAWVKQNFPHLWKDEQND